MFACTPAVAWSFPCNFKQPGTLTRREIAGRQGCAATSSVRIWCPTPGRRALSNALRGNRRCCRRGFEGRRLCSCRAASAPSAPPPPVPAWPPGRAPRFDVLTLSNLAVDVLTPVAQLPSSDLEVRRRLLAQLMAREPSPEMLEAGGSTNLCFTASRLGLKAGAVGCCSWDVYGRFLRRCLEAENIALVPLHEIEQDDGADSPAALFSHPSPLRCFVLVDPSAGHSFCSSYDLGPWPLLPRVTSLSSPARAALAQTRALFVSGFCLDDLPSPVVLEAVHEARRAGACVLFDPGPRVRALQRVPGARRALDALLREAHVVLMTGDEGACLTGEREPLAQARVVLELPGSKARWCVVKQGADGCLLAWRGELADWGANDAEHLSMGRPRDQRSPSSPGPVPPTPSAAPSLHSRALPALPVAVGDTVGCGDSVAAAIALSCVRGWSDPEAVLGLAVAVGAATAQSCGAGRRVAGWKAVLGLLRSSVQGAGEAAPGVQRALSVALSNLLAEAAAVERA